MMFKQSEVKGIRIALKERDYLNHISLHKTFKNETVSRGIWHLTSQIPASHLWSAPVAGVSIRDLSQRSSSTSWDLSNICLFRNMQKHTDVSDYIECVVMKAWVLQRNVLFI